MPSLWKLLFRLEVLARAYLFVFLPRAFLFMITCVRASRYLMQEDVIDDETIQNSNTPSHERSGSGGSTTAVVGMVLNQGEDDYRIAETVPDEYASHLS